jgi:hypothetical protein
MLPFELKPNCLSTQTIYVTVEMQLEINSPNLALSVRFTHVTVTEQIGLAREGDDYGFADDELPEFSNASSKKAVYIQLK